MASVSLSITLKANIRGSCEVAMRNTAQVKVKPEDRTKFDGEAIFQRYLNTPALRQAVKTIRDSPFGEHMNKNSGYSLRYELPDADERTPMVGERPSYRPDYHIRNYSNRFRPRLNAISPSHGAFTFHGEAKKESILIPNYGVLEMKAEWPITLQLMRRWAIEKQFHDRVSTYSGFIHDFLEARKGMGVVNRDWPLLVTFASSDVQAKLGKTKARGERDVSLEDDAFMEEINAMCSLGLLLPQQDNSIYRKLFIFS
jgi:hypothetical protein